MHWVGVFIEIFIVPILVEQHIEGLDLQKHIRKAALEEFHFESRFERSALEGLVGVGLSY